MASESWKLVAEYTGPDAVDRSDRISIGDGALDVPRLDTDGKLATSMIPDGVGGGSSTSTAAHEFWTQAISGNSYLAVGTSSASDAGTKSLIQTAAAGVVINHASNATTGTDAGTLVSASILSTFTFDVTFDIRTGANSTDLDVCRLWVGLTPTSGNLKSSDDPLTATPSAVPCIAFRYAPATDGTAFWRTVTSDGTTKHVTTTTAAIAVDTRYTLRITGDGSTITFYVNGSSVATHTTDLPASTSVLGCIANNRTLENVAKNLRIGRIHGIYSY